jgi:hypothetical protein
VARAPVVGRLASPARTGDLARKIARKVGATAKREPRSASSSSSRDLARRSNASRIDGYDQLSEYLRCASTPRGGTLVRAPSLPASGRELFRRRTTSRRGIPRGFRESEVLPSEGTSVLPACRNGECPREEPNVVPRPPRPRRGGSTGMRVSRTIGPMVDYL